MIKSFARILLILFVLGIIIVQAVRNHKQEATINELEQELAETREELTIRNDQLNQINKYLEREQYMGSDQE